MICNVYWKDKKRTPPGWEPEDEHGIARLVQREMRVTGFVRDGVKVEIDEPDLDYFASKFPQLQFERNG